MLLQIAYLITERILFLFQIQQSIPPMLPAVNIEKLDILIIDMICLPSQIPTSLNLSPLPSLMALMYLLENLRLIFCRAPLKTLLHLVRGPSRWLNRHRGFLLHHNIIQLLLISTTLPPTSSATLPTPLLPLKKRALLLLLPPHRLVVVVDVRVIENNGCPVPAVAPGGAPLP